MGMCLAAQMSARLGWISDANVSRITALIEKMALPTRMPDNGLTPAQMLALMQVDKKVLAGKIRLVLLQEMGQAVVTDQYDPNVLRETVSSQS